MCEFKVKWCQLRFNLGFNYYLFFLDYLFDSSFSGLSIDYLFTDRHDFVSTDVCLQCGRPDKT